MWPTGIQLGRKGRKVQEPSDLVIFFLLFFQSFHSVQNTGPGEPAPAQEPIAAPRGGAELAAEADERQQVGRHVPQRRLADQRPERVQQIGVVEGQRQQETAAEEQVHLTASRRQTKQKRIRKGRLPFDDDDCCHQRSLRRGDGLYFSFQQPATQDTPTAAAGRRGR